MRSKEKHNPLKAIQFLANDIAKSQVVVGGIPYWNVRSSKGIWGYTNPYPLEMKILVNAGLLSKKYVRRVTELGRSLPEIFFLKKDKRLPGALLYVVLDKQKIGEIAEIEEVALTILGFKSTRDVIPITFEEAINRVKKEIKESGDPNALLVEVISRLLSKTP
jgi:hypothetical protein